MPFEGLFTFGQLAVRFGVQDWKIRKVFERGLLATPRKVGNLRVVPEADLPLVKAALVRAGYLAA